jgi:hypothetical protein
VGYYKIHSERKTWHEARKICEQEGGHLAIINSEEESSVLQSIFAPVATKLGAAFVSIGFHDLYTEGQYLTIFGKESLSKNIEHMEYIMVIYRSQSRDSSVSKLTRTGWMAWNCGSLRGRGKKIIFPPAHWTLRIQIAVYCLVQNKVLLIS